MNTENTVSAIRIDGESWHTYIESEGLGKYTIWGLQGDCRSTRLGKILYLTDMISEFNSESGSWVSPDYNAFKHMRKTKGKKIVFIDRFEVAVWARGNGVGKLALHQFLILMRNRGYEVVCLKAHPIIKAHFGIYIDKSRSEIATEKRRIKDFYTKNGFEVALSGKDYLYKYI